MANRSNFRPTRPFTKAFGIVVRQRMEAEGITQTAFGKRAGHDNGYISERVNGHRAFSTEDIDALAELISERHAAINGRDLLIELAKAVKDGDVGGVGQDRIAPVTPLTPKQREAEAMTPEELEAQPKAATSDDEMEQPEPEGP